MSSQVPHAVRASTVFDGETTWADGAVMIQGDRITWVGLGSDLPTGVPVHVLPDGTWLAPGFIDLQVNGGADIMFNADPSPAAAARIAAAHRRFGTTALLPTLISDTRERMQAALDAVREAPGGSGIIGVHFEGPFLSPDKPGVHDRAMFRQPDADDVHLLTTADSGSVLVTLAPECVPAGFISALVKAGVRVALGHSMATYAETRRALAEGMTGFTHLFNAMRPMGSREPGPIAAALETEGASFGMIVDGVHVDPVMLRLALRGKATPMLVTDAMPPVGGTMASFVMGGHCVEANGASCFRDDGVLAGTALDMATAVRNCVRLLGVLLPAALRYAAVEPARFLGIEDRRGRLVPGLQADMVALEPADVRVLGTWVGGEWAAGA